MTEEHEEEEEKTKTELQQQIQKSAELLERLVEEGEEYVTNVRVANDAREVDRREAEGVGREKIIEQLENEATAAQNMFHEIAEKWSIIQNYHDPLSIHEDITNQKEKCDLLISQKDAIIAMLRDDIKRAERKFTKDQRKQMDDIDILTQRIEKQVTFMRHAFQKELELIELAILHERQNLIDANNKKWDELFKKRDQQEVENSEAKFEQVEKFEEQMTNIRIDFQEKFRETKIKLENDIDYLQRELERIKALSLLNSEKMDYNYQILKKREDENILLKSQQKRRINKLQDVINDLRKKIADYEQSTNNHIKKLSEDIKKSHKSIIDVEAKADRFAQINDEKFLQIWEMNRKSCQTILKKILATDKVLHEQQMGISWDPPNHDIMDKEQLPSYKDALVLMGHTESVGDTHRSPTSVVSTSSQKIRKCESSQLAESSLLEIPENPDWNPTYRNLLKYILTHISDKCGFLSEKRLKDLLKPYENDQEALVRVDNVFEALKINKKEDIDLLVNYFMPYAFCPICCHSDLTHEPSVLSRLTSKLSQMSSLFAQQENMDIVELDEAFNAVNQPSEVIEEVVLDLVSSEQFLNKDISSLNSEDMCGGALQEQSATELKDKATKKKQKMTDDKLMCRFNHPLVISTVYILMALRHFVTDYYKQMPGLPTTQQRLSRKRHTISRLLEEKDIKLYWDKFKTIYHEDRIRVWDALFEGLKKYHEILTDRKNACEEVIGLRKQNEDLKRLLANYMDHGEYMKPPCAAERENCLNTTPPPYTKSK